jgi:tetratricopeptide (TPR) repeat protein
LVTGRSGVGKSRLCAEVAARAANAGCAVVYLLPSRTPEAGLGPFLAVLPQLRRDFAAIEQSSADIESRRAALWAAALSAIDDEAAGRTVLLIVDDAQWLDSQSQELVQHISRLVSDTKIVLLVSGRDDVDATAWRELSAELARSGAPQLDVSPVGEAELAQLVRSQAPGLTALHREGIIREVIRTSGGLPGVAAIVVGSLVDAAADRHSEAATDPGAALQRIVASLPRDARAVGVALAVLGSDADVVALVDVTGLDQPSVISGLAELCHRQLALERSVARFGLAHLLIETAFVGSELQTTVAALHRLAAERLDLDLHARAVHEAGAVPFVSESQAAQTLIASANRYLDEGLYREAAQRFRHAVRLLSNSDRSIDPTEGGRYARALDLAGDHNAASQVRQHAFDAAIAARSHSQALDIATSGLPEAERIDGDRSLVANLLRVDSQTLTRDAQWRLAHQLTRQLTVVGQLSDARLYASRARELALTPHEHLRAIVGERFAISVTAPPASRVTLLNEAAKWLDHADVGTQSELLLLRSLDLYEAGAHAEATASHDELRALSPHLTPLRHWHSLLFEAMLATSRGEMSNAKALRASASEFGLSSGIAEHSNAWLAGEFVDLWLAKRASELKPAVGVGALDPEGTVLAQGGAAIVLAACGNHDAAQKLAGVVTRSVLQSPVSQGVAALALMCEILATVDDRDLKANVRAMLGSRGTSFIVVGAGAATLGPVHRYLAMLEVDPVEQRRCLSIAFDAAQKSGSLLWQAIALRDLHEMAADVTAGGHFKDLVSGTELAQFLTTVD